MPSVGSTPTLTSPQQQQSHQQQLQHSLPLQLKLQLFKQQQQQQQQQVTTAQPSPAGTYSAKSLVTAGNTTDLDDADDPPSTVSSTNSFSSGDTNQTILNSIATQTQQQSLLNSAGSKRVAANVFDTSNRSYRSKYSQFMIITPAVSIDRNFDNETGTTVADAVIDNDEPYFNNGNVFRTLLQSSIDSGNSSDSSFCSNYNPNIHSSRYHLLPETAPTFYTFSSWRWCTLICAAMRCFGGGQHHSGSKGATAIYSTSLARPPYQRSRSSGVPTSSTTPLRRLRSSSTSAEPFSAFMTTRKTCDHMNNITYEL